MALPRQGRYYLSTAINYTNGLPHMGHAYEAVIADVLTRYHRNFGRDVFFQTGTDEHGQKIAQTAASDAWNCTPQELCDHFAGQFQKLNTRLELNHDFYVRTTMDIHHKTAQALWRRAFDAGDIYLSEYEGWYNTREETYITDKDAEESDFKDPVSGVPLTRMKESSFFFRMSKYQERLVKHMTENPTFVQPDFRRNELLTRLQEPLMDLCISRTKFSWGVPVPTCGDVSAEGHVMYVWFDALANYITGIDYFGVTGDAERQKKLAPFWPVNVHLIGKDILWFHAVIWPTILMSAGIPVPQGVLAHGFVNAGDGRKMSKSLGNVVDPNECLDAVGCDSFRFFVMQAAKIGEDFPFVREQMFDLHNAILNDQLGNLVHRATNMTHKYCPGAVTPSIDAKEGAEGLDITAPFDSVKVAHSIEEHFAANRLQEALEEIIGTVRETNKFLQTQQPWAKDRTDNQRVAILRVVLEALHFIGHIVEPFMPHAGKNLIEKLGDARVPLALFLDAAPGTLLPAGLPVTVGEPLFNKAKDPLVAAAEEAAAAEKAAAAADKAAKKAAKLNPNAIAANEMGSKAERKAAKAARREAVKAAKGDGADGAVEETVDDKDE